jgi:ComF family protein
MRSVFVELVQVFVPKLCLGCQCSLPKSLHQLCLSCLEKLPFTHYEKSPINPLYKLLICQNGIEGAVSLFFFEKEGLLQKLIHSLKYKGQYSLGVFFGQMLGKKLAAANLKSYTMVIPVPLHKKRQRYRGYNQVAGFGKALAQTLGIAYNDHLLYRHKPTKTLVRMTKTQRWEQVRDAFGVHNLSALNGHHILLVDDVITTGATLSAAVRAVSAQEGVRISIAAIAFAQSPLP